MRSKRRGKWFQPPVIAARASAEPLEGRQLLSATLTTLAVFNTNDGFQPGHLVLDSAGNLYGTTKTSVFEIAAGTHKFNNLARFSAAGSAYPDALTIDGAGNLYGATLGGGNGHGTVFEISTGTHAFTTLVTFNGTDGSGPTSAVADAAGNIYLSTMDGRIFVMAAGIHSLPTVAALDPANGYTPGGLALDSAGNLYGVTGDDRGAVFKVVANTHVLTIVATFPPGEAPTGLAVDAAGNIYCTGDGGIAEISAGTNRTTVLATVDGNLWGSLLIDNNGDLFGANVFGGGVGVNGLGSVTELVAGSRAVLSTATFDGEDGSYPQMGLVADAAGDLYVATFNQNYASGVVPDSALVGGSVVEISGAGFVPDSSSVSALIAQPTNQTGVVGHDASFTAAAGGYPEPTVQWQQSTDSGRTFRDITGNLSANTSTLTLTDVNPSQNGTKYRAIFTNSLGSVTTDVVKLAVVPLALVSPAHASPSTVTGATTTLSALADSTDGEAGLIYKWSVIDAPAGAASPTFSANNSNAARQVAATFHKDGRYLFGCIISDGEGNKIKTDVQVEVSQKTTSLRLSPHHQTVSDGETLAFHATVVDQFGHPMRTRPAIDYSILSGPGTIDSATGLFSSPAPGAALIQAEEGDLSGTVGVQIIV